MKLLKLILVLCAMCNCLIARFDIRMTNFGQWEAYLSNYGKFGQSSGGSAGAFWPRGSGHNYMFGSGMWYGGIAPNGDTLVTIGYGPHGGEAEFGPGIPYATADDPYWHVYFSNDDDYPFPQISFEDSWAVSNDFDPLNHMPGDTRPIGIKITQWTHVWPRDWADDILFLRYVIKNDTNYTINNTYTGFCMDYDIGNESGMGNDQGTCDITNKLFYGWQNIPEPGWSDRGMVGLKLLSAQPLTAYKRFTLSFEPNQDGQRYLTLAGYNFITGEYQPFDTIPPAPDDQRCLMATGVFNLPAGDSIIFDWAFIGSHDTIPPANDMYYKAYKAQVMYNTGLHTVHVTDPNGGEVVSQTYPIHYTSTSITPNPLQADIYFFSENFMDTIAWGVNASGVYNWSSTGVPDCVLGRIAILAFDSITFGYDRTDGYFIVNNPGNSPPYLRILTPADNDTIVRDVVITWFARDPEYYDSLPINIYYKSVYDSTYQLVASGEENDSVYSWNTLPLRNGPGSLVVETNDGQFTVADTVQAYLRNHISGGYIGHVAGLNNTLQLSVIVHDSADITGHVYKVRFLQYQATSDTTHTYYFPIYSYTLTDSNTGSVLLDSYSIIKGYEENGTQLAIDDYSPIVDGFSIQARTVNDTDISLSHFRNDSVHVIAGSYPENQITLWSPYTRTWWAYRGSHVRLEWYTKSGGGLTIRPVDMDYGDTISYKPYNMTLNPDSAFGWCFSQTSGVPSDTLRSTDLFIMFCGQRIRFSRSVPPPEPGDIWIVVPKPWAPPIAGNIYRFQPHYAIAENDVDKKPVSFQAFPNPALKIVTLQFTLPKEQFVHITIYDVAGRCVKTIQANNEDAGIYSMIWDGTDANCRRVSAGVYFCRFETESLQATKKIVLLR